MACADADMRITSDDRDRSEGDRTETAVMKYYQASEILPARKGPMDDLLKKQPAVLGVRNSCRYTTDPALFRPLTSLYLPADFNTSFPLPKVLEELKKFNCSVWTLILVLSLMRFNHKILSVRPFFVLIFLWNILFCRSCFLMYYTNIFLHHLYLFFMLRLQFWRLLLLLQLIIIIIISLLLLLIHRLLLKIMHIYIYRLFSGHESSPCNTIEIW